MQQFKYNGRWVSADEIRKLRELRDHPQSECPYCSGTNHKKCKGDLISIIIPSRIDEEIESLESIENQTYKNYEVIIEIDEKKEGAAVVRNRGAEKAKGKYIFFCDNDVKLVPDCLEVLWKEIKKQKADVACGQVVIDGTNVTGKKGNIPSVKNTIAYARFFHGVSTMSLIKASVKPKFDNKMLRFDDWDLWMTLDKKKHKFIFLDKVILTTVNRPQGISSQDNSAEWTEKLYKKHKIGKKIADIIIPHHNRHDHLKRCLEGIDNSMFNIIVVSGGTFAENCNRGVLSAKTNTFIFLNDDVETENDKLVELASASGDYVGNSQYINGTKYYGIGWKNIGKGTHDGLSLSRTPKDVLVPSGYCFKFTRKAWEKIGGLNEIFKNGAEDTDIGLRAIVEKLKIKFVDFPMVHKHSQSEGRFEHAYQNNNEFDKIWTKKIINNIKKNGNI